MPFSLGLSCSSRFLMNSLDTNFTKNRGITLNQVLVVSVNLNVQMNKNMCLFQFCIEIFKTYIQNFEKILLVTTLVKHFSIEGINGKRISRKRFSILLGRQYFCVKLNHCPYSKHELHRFCFCHNTWTIVAYQFVTVIVFLFTFLLITIQAFLKIRLGVVSFIDFARYITSL